MARELIGIYQATKRFPDLSTSRIYVGYAKGQLEAVRRGQRLFFSPTELERFRASLAAKEAAARLDVTIMAERARAATRRARAKAEVEAAAILAKRRTRERS